MNVTKLCQIQLFWTSSNETENLCRIQRLLAILTVKWIKFIFTDSLKLLIESGGRRNGLNFETTWSLLRLSIF